MNASATWLVARSKVSPGPYGFVGIGEIGDVVPATVGRCVGPGS